METFAMGTPDKYNVHDINVQHIGVFTGTGQWKAQTQVRYYVGTNGPFTLVYDQGQDTPDAIKADIQKQVATLQAIGA